jgi:nicotinamide-nucleotide amidase
MLGLAMISELEKLAEQVGLRLIDRGEMLATAESCTGGWVAQSLTAIAGSSAWFDRGFVTYSNAAKVDMLGVPKQPWRARARYRRRRPGPWRRERWCTAGLTGRWRLPALPGRPGNDRKAGWHGLFCLGDARGGCEAQTGHFPGDRAAVRALSVRHALTGLLARLQDASCMA